MKQCSKCQTEKDESEFYKHSHTTDGLKSECKSCGKLSRKRYYYNNKQKELERCKNYSKENKDKVKLHRQKYLKKSNYATIKKYRQNNPDKIRCYVREYLKKWIKNNPDKNRARNMKRHALKKRALSPDRNDKIIEVLYEQANRLFKCLGISFDLDHILPLSKGGQHHENNLQVIPAVFNRQKNNSLDYICPYPNFKIHKVVVTQSK